jgi:hypothetical protein
LDRVKSDENRRHGSDRLDKPVRSISKLTRHDRGSQLDCDRQMPGFADALFLRIAVF